MKRHRAVRPSSTRRAVQRTLESLEQRLVFNTTYFPLNGATLSQNWDNTPDQLTVKNDWSGVPSIEGYDGAGLTTGTSSDPSTLTAASPTGALSVTVNSASSPTTFGTGGLVEFNLAAPIAGSLGATTGNTTVAFQGSVSANAPYLKFYLNSTGVGTVRVKYDLIDIDGGNVAKGPQQVALQYRTSPTGSWANVPAGYVADASDWTTSSGGVNGTVGGSGIGKQTSINVTLPSDAANAPQLEVRVMTTDTNGSDQEIAIENIAVSGEGATSAQGTLSLPTTLSTPESAGTYNIVVNRAGGTTGAVSVAYTIAAGTATTPADFTVPGGLTGTVNFADGQSTANIPVTIVNDTLVEGPETFSVTLSSPGGGATLGSPSTGTVTITDDDVAGQFAFNPTTYTVNENAGVAHLTVARSGGSAGALTVNYATADGTATDGSDYTGTSTGTVNFADGQTTATIDVPIIDDTIGETTEAFTVMLTGVTSGTGATLGSAKTATVTINDNDTSGTIAFSPTAYTVSESAGTVTLTLTRTNGTTGLVTANYSTADGTATAPGDYTAVSNGVVTFADGATTASIIITINDDTISEANETFSVTLSSPTGGAVIGSTPTATVTIADNDVNIPSGLLINEALIDPPSSNTPYQYVEIRGTPGTVLNNVFLYDVEGDSGDTPGLLEQAFDLSNYAIGSNGLAIIHAASGGFTPTDAATTDIPMALLNSDHQGFQVGSQTMLLVYHNPGGAAAPTVGTDLDTDDVATNGIGTLDALPASITTLDGFSTTDGGASDIAYGPLLPKLTTGGAADAVVRFSNATQAMSTSSFYYGIVNDNDGAGTGSATLTFYDDPNRRSANFPTDGILTPGGTNAGTTVITDTTPPTVVSAIFNPQQSQQITVTFSEDVRNTTNTIDASDFSLVNTTTGTPVTLAVNTVSSDGKTVTLTFSGTGGAGAGAVLTNGSYTFKVLAGQIADVAGNTLAADATTTFTFANADFNNSGKVEFGDLVILAQNYNTTGKTFATGDANYDGNVNFADLVILAQNYGMSVAALASIVGVSDIPVSPPVDSTKPGIKKDGPISITPIATPVATKPVPKSAGTTFATAKQIA